MSSGDNRQPAVAFDRDKLKDKQPTRIVSVPPQFQRNTTMIERTTLINDVYIATTCEMSIEKQQGSGKILAFQLYGFGKVLDRATDMVNQWISKAHTKASGSAAWARMNAFDSNQWYYNQVEQLEQERKKMFTKDAPKLGEDAPSLPSDTVDWPERLLKRNPPILPDKFFGDRLECLDYLKMRDEVFYALERGTKLQIRIEAFNIENVRNGKEHLINLIRDMENRTLPFQDKINLILDNSEGLDVIIEEAETWWPYRKDFLVPRLLPDKLTNLPGSFRRVPMHLSYLMDTARSIQTALEAIRCRSGSYDFALRLGRLVLTSGTMPESQRGKTFPQRIFLKSIDMSVQLQVKRWTFDNELGVDILQRLAAANHLLVPISARSYYGRVPETLAQTRPTLRGTWAFGEDAVRDSQGASKVYTLVRIDWTENDDGEYEKTEIRYFQFERGKMEPETHAEINLLELGESRAWSFALESMKPVLRKLVSPSLTSFADGVSLAPGYKMSSSANFACWKATPATKHLKTGRMDKIYSFGFRGSGYKVELGASWYPKQKEPVWGLSVTHVDWPTHLAELERLHPGGQASWNGVLSTFFPADDAEIANDASEQSNPAEESAEDFDEFTDDESSVEEDLPELSRLSLGKSRRRDDSGSAEEDSDNESSEEEGNAVEDGHMGEQNDNQEDQTATENDHDEVLYNGVQTFMEKIFQLSEIVSDLSTTGGIVL